MSIAADRRTGDVSRLAAATLRQPFQYHSARRHQQSLSRLLSYQSLRRSQAHRRHAQRPSAQTTSTPVDKHTEDASRPAVATPRPASPSRPARHLRLLVTRSRPNVQRPRRISVEISEVKVLANYPPKSKLHMLV
nr:hypothetical protein CFP56_10502 [Quercus suber]